MPAGVRLDGNAATTDAMQAGHGDPHRDRARHQAGGAPPRGHEEATPLLRPADPDAEPGRGRYEAERAKTERLKALRLAKQASDEIAQRTVSTKKRLSAT